MLFDYLVIGQVLPANPATAVRGPKHVVKRGKTPVLSPDQARALLDSIDVSTVAGLRDRAIIGAMVFSFARVSALIGMNVEDLHLRIAKFTGVFLGDKSQALPIKATVENVLAANEGGSLSKLQVNLFSARWRGS
jgi:site-specific recombinase XerC